jgi:hypothetical protein
MKRWLITALVAAALAPAAALAGGGAATNASNDCSALKARMGATAFAQAYSTFGACASRFAQLEQQNDTSANATCTAQQNDSNFAMNHNGKTFAQFYGTGKNANNAFGKCVSSIAKTSSQVEQQGRMNPAQTCRATRSKLGTSVFAKTYGKNANDKNAFGKCVSTTAKAQSQNELSAAATCQAEQKAGEDAFEQKFGTNADLSDAFGKCVSTAAADKSTAQQQAIVNGAQTCAAQEKSMGESAFMTKYGTFGRCVSQQAASK